MDQKDTPQENTPEENTPEEQGGSGQSNTEGGAPIPSSIVEVPHKYELSSVLTRIGALLIDGLLTMPFIIPIFLVMPFVEDTGGEPPDWVWFVIIACYIGIFVFSIWNTIVRMGKTGQSLGRKFLNIAVLDFEGNPIGVGKAALREIFGRWISGMVCYIGYLNAFWDRDRQMWHDKMASCYVYYVEENFS